MTTEPMGQSWENDAESPPKQEMKESADIVDQIQRQIKAGEVRAGKKLPSEAKMTLLLGTSKASVREAIRVLESKGVVCTRTGSGTCVT